MVCHSYHREAPSPMPPVVRQAAAIPLKDGLVCMVTSRSGRRWVLPKGRIEVKQSAGDAATTEAWEEAGVRGRLTDLPVGSYEYEKWDRPHHVHVFVLHVETVIDQWPERTLRTREWVTPEEAIARIEEPALRALVAAVCGVAVAAA